MDWTLEDVEWMLGQVSQYSAEAEEKLDEMVTQQFEAKTWSGYTEEMVKLADRMAWASNLQRRLQIEKEATARRWHMNLPSTLKMDADMIGEMLCACAKLKAQWQKYPGHYFNLVRPEQQAYMFHRLGRIERSLEDDRAEQIDLDTLELWIAQANKWEEYLHEEEDA